MTLPGTPITPLFPLLERKEPFSKSLNPLSTKKSQVLPPIGLVLSFTLSNTQRLKDYRCYRSPTEKGVYFLWFEAVMRVHTVNDASDPGSHRFPSKSPRGVVSSIRTLWNLNRSLCQSKLCSTLFHSVNPKVGR